MARSNDPNDNLAPVRNQNFLEHSSLGTESLILLEFAKTGRLSGYDKDFVDQPSTSRRAANAIALLSITACAAALRFHALGAKTFWFDEGVSVGIARLDAYNFLRILWRREANMSLYYILLHAWLWLGNSEAFIRSLSVIFALATIPAIYFLGRRLFDSRTGLVAAVLLSVNAFHLCYSQEARSYSLMVLLCILSSLYFVKTVENQSPPNRRAYVAFSALAVYAHFYSLLLIVAQYLSLRYFAALQASSGPWKRTWRTIAIVVSPILLFVATTGAGPLKWIPRPGLKDLWSFAILMTGHDGVLLLVAIAVLFAVGIYPIIRSTTREELWPSQFLLVWLFFPILVVLVLSFARPLFLPRYFIFCLPALLLPVSSGLRRIRPGWLQIPALLLVVLLSLRGTISYYHQDFDNERDDWRAASTYVLSQAQPGDALLFHVPMGRMPYEYYHSLANAGMASPTVLYPSHGPRITFLDFVEKPDYARISNSLPQYRRVWVVIAHAETPDGFDLKATSLMNLAGEGRRNAQHTIFNGIDLFLYQ